MIIYACGKQIEHNCLREQTTYYTNRTTVITTHLSEVLSIMICIHHRHRPERK
jgi:hypothetical protein